MRSVRTAAMVLISVVGCSKSQRKPATSPPTGAAAPAGTVPHASAPGTPEGFPPDCKLALVTTLDGKDSATIGATDAVMLEASLENLTAADITIEIPYSCGIHVDFTGFGDLEAYYSRCMAGPCGSNFALKQTIPAGQRQSLLKLQLQQKMPCAAHAVASGAYNVSFTLPTASTGVPRTCSRPASITVH